MADLSPRFKPWYRMASSGAGQQTNLSTVLFILCKMLRALSYDEQPYGISILTSKTTTVIQRPYRTAGRKHRKGCWATGPNPIMPICGPLV
ncbi:hypothetical protein BO78DRAFT_393293 [Aspergillus sclerotiicarbonarius CBS 121057]|uniref:Uncharacterized protein n=1 Tax=Aspergillus sclerotiicarbonarius (strain CBS 121057 / IBT 28362) TaxID=1448318 RepID=A0A319FN18_ASPSB|nr:hypothetical protein BO78DRAFT_393293 [Aspergillus sclerotiicarbonarius CBS 121057]